MDRFSFIESTLSEFERQKLAELRLRFPTLHDLPPCVTGAEQFATVDDLHRGNDERLPVICAVGINYTQGGDTSSDGLVPYRTKSRDPGVVDNTLCRPGVALAVEAFARNEAAWKRPPNFLPQSPLGAYGSLDGTNDLRFVNGDVAALRDRFILIMTNISPFLTTKAWSKQVRATPGACRDLIAAWPSSLHLDSLFAKLGSSVDLWIGHSAIEGTAWVWPEFCKFLERHSISNWLLTPNISAQSRLNFGGHFTKRSHRLFPLFGLDTDR